MPQKGVWEINRIKKSLTFLFKTKKGNMIVSVISLSLIVLTFIAFRNLNLKLNGLFPPCYIKSLTGLSCLGCGATRATDELLHGNIIGAFRFNPAYAAAVFILFIYYLRFIYNSFNKNYKPFKFNLLRGKRIYVLLIILAVFLVVRNLPFYLNWFYL